MDGVGSTPEVFRYSDLAKALARGAQEPSGKWP